MSDSDTDTDNILVILNTDNIRFISNTNTNILNKYRIFSNIFDKVLVKNLLNTHVKII